MSYPLEISLETLIAGLTFRYQLSSSLILRYRSCGWEDLSLLARVRMSISIRVRGFASENIPDEGMERWSGVKGLIKIGLSLPQRHPNRPPLPLFSFFLSVFPSLYSCPLFVLRLLLSERPRSPVYLVYRSFFFSHTYAHRHTVDHISSAINAATTNVSVCRINAIRWLLCESTSRLVISCYLHSRRPRSSFLFPGCLYEENRGWRYEEPIRCEGERGTKRGERKMDAEILRRMEKSYYTKLFYRCWLNFASFSSFLLLFLHFSLACCDSNFCYSLFPPSYCFFHHFFCSPRMIIN